ncbi:class I SAM-dependent methyltransferase (plasmid) [Nocardia sp. NBC_01377]|uniref:class I SAM-dependent methyltransferase n=1 Tax=Nocardia sp. NBC_01377 TaxID=2903595 RepID=UPI002F91327E
MTEANEIRAGEDFFRRTHNQLSGEMSHYVVANPLPDGRSSYQYLADQVPNAQEVLDLGCGDGSLLVVLARNGATRLAGIDLSDVELSAATQRPELYGADLRQGRAQELPFADKSFDTVISHMALMLMAEIEQVFAEAARVLKPAGRLAISVGLKPAGGSGRALFEKVARPIFVTAQQSGAMPSLGDRRTRTREGLNELATVAGFQPIDWTEISHGPRATPEQAWQSAVDSYYDATLIEAGQLQRLRDEFLDQASDLAEEGLLAHGARMAIATTQLR